MAEVRIRIINTVTNEHGTYVIYELLVNGVTIETDGQETAMVASSQEFEFISKGAFIEEAGQ